MRTLELMHNWGYAPTVEVLAAGLLGGDVPPSMLREALRGSARVRISGGIAFLEGREDLSSTSVRRMRKNGLLNGTARAIAESYAHDLAHHCPFVQCMALAGSVASGGFAEGDDIDFDLFVEPGTKYITYLVANLTGLRYAWRFRKAAGDEAHRIPFLPKVVCINVVWPEDETRPFVRQDENLAFELFRCIPLSGTRRFEKALAENPWIEGHFPQILRLREPQDIHVPGSALAGFLRAVGEHPRLLRLAERSSRTASWILYRFVQSTRRNNPAAQERIEFLRRVKYPYEVFQD